jgi:hypothetical protein
VQNEDSVDPKIWIMGYGLREVWVKRELTVLYYGVLEEVKSHYCIAQIEVRHWY